ncbi:MAG: hypothetical protein WCO98_05125 [bacterium]
MMDNQSTTTLHPAITRTIERHRKFFAGTRDYLVKVSIPIDAPNVDTPPLYDDLNWDTDFERYVTGNVANGIQQARMRLDMGVDDDTIPIYYPYFGISIHHSFFGGKVTCSHGTSYAEPVINSASEWELLNPDSSNIWLRRLAWGLAFARDHGEGVLLSSMRGGNGPLDMANGVMGNELFTELYDDPENLHRAMEICTDAILQTFKIQAENCSNIAGGRIVPMGALWVPAPMIGHISLDAACLAGPAAYEKYEHPCLERMADKTTGFIIHTHMLGHRLFPYMLKTRGIKVFSPVDDPNTPTLIDEIDSVLAILGEVPLQLHIPENRLQEILPKLQGRRAVITLAATDADDARRQLEIVDSYCSLER